MTLPLALDSPSSFSVPFSISFWLTLTDFFDLYFFKITTQPTISTNTITKTIVNKKEAKIITITRWSEIWAVGVSSFFFSLINGLSAFKDSETLKMPDCLACPKVLDDVASIRTVFDTAEAITVILCSKGVAVVCKKEFISSDEDVTTTTDEWCSIGLDASLIVDDTDKEKHALVQGNLNLHFFAISPSLPLHLLAIFQSSVQHKTQGRHSLVVLLR